MKRRRRRERAQRAASGDARPLRRTQRRRATRGRRPGPASALVASTWEQAAAVLVANGGKATGGRERTCEAGRSICGWTSLRPTRTSTTGSPAAVGIPTAPTWR